jgi:ketosteroid isomerase-like protein
MRRNLLLAFAGAATMYAAASAPASPAGRTESGSDKLQEEIKQIERERNHAVLSGDAAALDRMTSEDYTFITQRGELRSKAEILAGFKSGSFRYSAREVSDLTVRVYGNAAVVTGHARQKGTENSNDYSGDNRFTRVYVRQGDRWITVALQVTLVEKP